MAEDEGPVFRRGPSPETYGVGECRRRPRTADPVRCGDADDRLFPLLGRGHAAYLQDASAGRRRAAANA